MRREPAYSAELAIDDQIVVLPWGRLLAAAAALALLLLSLWEGHWRSRDIRPSVSDLDASWSVARDWVEADSIVLLGTSKMQSALDPRRLGERLGTEPAIQLALIDSSPLPILEHLAADDGFRGTVVVDVAPRIFFHARNWLERGSRSILAAYRTYRSSPGDRVDARLVLGAETSLVLRRSSFSLRRILEMWTKSRPLSLPFDRVRYDRFRELDFSRLDLEVRRATQAMIMVGGRAVSPAGAADLRARTRRASAAIEARGGRVVLAFLPVSGAAREAEEKVFPRSEYWQPLVEATGLEAIHFLDYPSLAAFECRDGVHLETAQAESFTDAFAAILGTAG